ncbi:MAG: hypothetical protein HY683_05730 [Chloroflexi bacterium]|nr:hypothetical protein [Chloroflexota bacterium]
MRCLCGFALLETVVGLAVAAILLPAFLGALSITITSIGNTTLMDTARSAALSQLEYVQAQPFGGSYSTFVPLPEGFTVETQVQSITDELQKVIVTVSTPRGDQASLEGYKASRGPDPAVPPSAGGMDRAIALPSGLSLAKQTGYFRTVELLSSSAGGGELMARAALSRSDRLVSITVYQGTPLGEGSGTSAVAPGLVGATQVAKARDSVNGLGLAHQGLSAGMYTVYVYNEANGSVTMNEGWVACICR